MLTNLGHGSDASTSTCTPATRCARAGAVRRPRRRTLRRTMAADRLGEPRKVGRDGSSSATAAIRLLRRFFVQFRSCSGVEIGGLRGR